MGKYINTTSKGPIMSNHGKAQVLVEDGATIIKTPIEWRENLVCVVNNGMFEAAAYCYSEGELKKFLRPDGRSKTWLEYPKAKELAQ